MEKTTRQKSRAAKTNNKIASVHMGEDGEKVDGSVGRFYMPDFAEGEVRVSGNGDSLRIVFELDYSDSVHMERTSVSCDLVLGPADWHEGAEVFEVKAAPVIDSIVAFEIERDDVERITNDGRLQFYGRIHSGGMVRFINRDGHPFENFELSHWG